MNQNFHSPPFSLGFNRPQTKTVAERPQIQIYRTTLRELNFARVFRGGRPDDSGRVLRYLLVIAVGLCIAWLPAIAYLKYSHIQYTSHFSLILPGAGSSSSINLAEIGQASSASSSAYASASLSPTITYKNLIMSANVINAAAASLDVDPDSLSVPLIKLVDETSFISVDMTGKTPEEARNRAEAIQSAFFAELSKLRNDEIASRESATTETLKQYQTAVDNVRRQISELQVQSGLNSMEQFNALVTAADSLKTHMAEASAALAKDQQAISSLSLNLNTSPSLAALTLKLHADPEFAALAEATSKAESDYAETGRQFGPNHPKVVDSRAKFAGARKEMLARAQLLTGLKLQALAKQVDLAPTGQRPILLMQLVTLQADADGLSGELISYKSGLEVDRQQIANLTATAAKLDGLNRDYKVAEAVFASALARINTSKTDIFASYPMVQVTEAAIMPLTPSSPNKKVAFGAAAASTVLLLIGLLLGWVRRPLIDKLLATAKKLHE